MSWGFSAKSIAGLTLVISLICGAFAWGDDRPTTTTWIYRVLTAAAACGSLVYVIWHYVRPDHAPDYLKELSRSYFNRLGLAFFPRVARRGQTCYVDLFFQNQRDATCTALIVCYPRHQLLGHQPVHFRFDCGPAEFGYMSFPLGVPQPLQGRRVMFWIGATVDYPNGAGRLVRFRDGRCLEVNHALERSTHAKATEIVSAMVGVHGLAHLPGRVRLKLPQDVATTAQSPKIATATNLWRPGQSELTHDWLSRLEDELSSIVPR